MLRIIEVGALVKELVFVNKDNITDKIDRSNSKIVGAKSIAKNNQNLAKSKI